MDVESWLRHPRNMRHQQRMQTDTTMVVRCRHCVACYKDQIFDGRSRLTLLTSQVCRNRRSASDMRSKSAPARLYRVHKSRAWTVIDSAASEGARSKLKISPTSILCFEKSPTPCSLISVMVIRISSPPLSLPLPRLLLAQR